MFRELGRRGIGDGLGVRGLEVSPSPATKYSMLCAARTELILRYPLQRTLKTFAVKVS